MTLASLPRIQRFSLTGRVTDLETADGPYPKVIFVSAQTETYRIKLSKLARKSLRQAPGLGDILRIEGEREYQREKARFRYKADLVQILSKHLPDEPSLLPSPRNISSPVQLGKILICQKSNCCRRGGQAVWEHFEQLIQAQGLEEQILLKATGCLGECKRGPALVILPGKSRHTQVTPGQVPQLLASCQTQVVARL